jgi:hypothetical protein
MFILGFMFYAKCYFYSGSKLSNCARVWTHLCRNFIINLFINQGNVEKEKDANPDSRTRTQTEIETENKTFTNTEKCH